MRDATGELSRVSPILVLVNLSTLYDWSSNRTYYVHAGMIASVILVLLNLSLFGRTLNHNDQTT